MLNPPLLLLLLLRQLWSCPPCPQLLSWWVSPPPYPPLSPPPAAACPVSWVLQLRQAALSSCLPAAAAPHPAAPTCLLPSRVSAYLRPHSECGAAWSGSCSSAGEERDGTSDGTQHTHNVSKAGQTCRAGAKQPTGLQDLCIQVHSYCVQIEQQHALESIG